MDWKEIEKRMRIAFVGAGEMAVRTAQRLIGDDHEVIIIERDEAKIEELSDELDCSFLHGDGTRPDILRQVNPKETDLLFCLTDSDKDNVIASLVGRSLGFRRCVTRIENPDLEAICRELGLENTIIPSQTISRYLEDMVRGLGKAELSTVLKDEARFFSFTIEKREAGLLKELNLPPQAKVVCYYRDGKFNVADEQTKLKAEDEVVLITHSKNLPELQERWNPKAEDLEGHRESGLSAA